MEKEQAKIAVAYDRQVALFGQKAADTVLQFYMLGYADANKDMDSQKVKSPLYKEEVKSKFYEWYKETITKDQGTIFDWFIKSLPVTGDKDGLTKGRDIQSDSYYDNLNRRYRADKSLNDKSKAEDLANRYKDITD